MHLDWHGYTLLGGGCPPVDEAKVFSCNGGKMGKVVLVESEDERELVEALQLIYGGEVNIQLCDDTSWTGVMSWRTNFSRVYCTWNPLDPNR